MYYHVKLGLRKQSSQDRLDELLQSPAFHRIHQRHGGRPSSLSSTLAYCLRTVDGDLEKEHLGLPAASYDKFLASVVDLLQVFIRGRTVSDWCFMMCEDFLIFMGVSLK